MRYNKIRKMDISNGPGIRVSIFMQGCTFKCKNCFNPETWDFNGGEELTKKTIEKIIELCSNPNIKGLSILGGEPLHPKNIEGTTLLAKKVKEKLPKKTIWIWTGFKYEDLKHSEIFNYIDVLVDGRYKDELRNPKLKYCGSTNQRVIDIKKTLKNRKIVLYETNKEVI